MSASRIRIDKEHEVKADECPHCHKKKEGSQKVKAALPPSKEPKIAGPFDWMNEEASVL